MMFDKVTYRYAIVGLSVAVGLFLVGASTIAAVGHTVPKELWTVGTALGGGLLGVLVPSPRATSRYTKALAEANAAHGAAAKAADTAVNLAAGAPAPAKANNKETAQQAVARVKSKAQAAANDVRSSSHLSVAITAASPNPGTGAACDELATQHRATAVRLNKQAAAPGVNKARQGELKAQAAVFTAAANAVEGRSGRVEAMAAVKSTNTPLPDSVVKLLVPFVVGGVALYLGTRLVGKIPAHHDFQYAIELGKNVKNGPELMKHYLEALSKRQGNYVEEGNQLLALATAAGGAIIGVLVPSPGQPKASSEPAKS